MQISIPFDYPEQPKQEKILEEHILKEFQQGNFSKALETKLSSEEIADILLQDVETPEKLKIDILEYMITKCNNEKMYEGYEKTERTIIEETREHNDEVRDRLLQAFNSEDPEKLKKVWLDKFRKFNNRYRKKFWGKSIKDVVINWRSGESSRISIEIEDIKKKIKNDKIQWISKCIEKIKKSHISKELKLLAKLREKCEKKEFDEMLTQNNFSEEEKEEIFSYQPFTI